MDTAQIPTTLHGAPATYVNEKYGPHERNTFDLWLANSAQPTPLIIFIHGGGFVGGDKSRYYDSEDWDILLQKGISIATINYRFLYETPHGILGCMNDSKRCLQYIRHKAKEFNIDKNRIACSGGSAGAGTSLWIAFSDDMATPGHKDPVLRESTKISCAGAFSTQATYDILEWENIFNIPLNSGEHLQSIGMAFGSPSADTESLKKLTKTRQQLDFLSKIKASSPPFYVSNLHDAGIPQNEDELNHHPLHAKTLLNKAQSTGARAVVYAPALDISDQSGMTFIDFIEEHL